MTDRQREGRVRILRRNGIRECAVPGIISFQLHDSAACKVKVRTSAEEEMRVDRIFSAGPGIGTNGSHQTSQVRRAAGAVIPADALRRVFF